jgi:hypothetical protein
MSISGAVREHRALLVIGAMAAGAALARVSLCPFATLTGLPCPGCGLLRATLAIMRGHFAESFHIHPLALLVVPTVAVVALRVRDASPMTRHAEAALSTIVGALVVAMLGVWVARFSGAFGGPVAVNSIWTMHAGTLTR